VAGSKTADENATVDCPDKITRGTIIAVADKEPLPVIATMSDRVELNCTDPEPDDVPDENMALTPEADADPIPDIAHVAIP
jgi:hypothetical protein